MAAYEVLLLNTAIPQIQAAQAGDTYVVPRDIAFSTVASFAAGTEALPSLVATGDVNTGFWFPAADTIAASTGGTRRLTLDASGNLGLGVTPSADWDATTTSRAIQIGRSGAIAYNTNNSWTAVYGNAYQTGLNAYKRISNGYAGFYAINDFNGEHQWYIASSSTAGSSFTPTQAMTLDASGRLLIGATSGTRKLEVHTVNGTETAILLNQSGVGAATLFVPASTNALAFGVFDGVSSVSERARITSGGDLLVGTNTALNGTARLDVNALTGNNVAATLKNDAGANQWTAQVWNAGTSGDNSFIQFATETAYTGRGSITYNRGGGLVAYNTTSDYRAKDVTGPVVNSGATIDALKVYNGKIKGATVERPMLIAHEAQEFAPYAVVGEKDAVNENGDPVFQQMDVSSLVPLLIAEIQSLRARVAQLEAK